VEDQQGGNIHLDLVSALLQAIVDDVKFGSQRRDHVQSATGEVFFVHLVGKKMRRK
jgi:hypothetical protein